MRLSTVIVHSASLAETVGPDAPKVRVIPHPLYHETQRLHLPMPDHAGKGNKRCKPVIAFIGALRTDKGSGDLSTIIASVSMPVILRVMGRDRLSRETESVLATNGGSVEYVGGARGPTDGELVAGMVGSSLLIAPYRLVTESGSLLMAVTLKVPILGYYSRELSRSLTARSMADGPEELGRLISQFVLHPWDTVNADVLRRHSSTGKLWIAALNE